MAMRHGTKPLSRTIVSDRLIPMPYFFYLARCRDRSLYAGYCKNLEERERQHNDGAGAKYTRSRRPVHIVYSEHYATRSEAMRRESHIKQWSKEQKERLVEEATISH